MLQVITSQARPKLMPTIQSHAETMLRARMVLNIQDVSVKPGGEEAGGGLVVFEDNDAEWRSWVDFGPWQDVRSTLQRFNRAAGSVAHTGCIVLSELVLAEPPYAITDLRCPAINDCGAPSPWLAPHQDQGSS